MTIAATSAPWIIDVTTTPHYANAFPWEAQYDAITALLAAGFDASILQPDAEAEQIIAAWEPYHRLGETWGQDLMRANQDTAYWRIWLASDGTTRISDDQHEGEWTYPNLETAVSALIDNVQRAGRA